MQFSQNCFTDFYVKLKRREAAFLCSCAGARRASIEPGCEKIERGNPAARTGVFVATALVLTARISEQPAAISQRGPKALRNMKRHLWLDRPQGGVPIGSAAVKKKDDLAKFHWSSDFLEPLPIWGIGPTSPAEALPVGVGG
jgi:hypothetical protein